MDLQRDSNWEMNGGEGHREGEAGIPCNALFQRVPISSFFEKKGWLTERLFFFCVCFSAYFSSPAVCFKSLLPLSASLSFPCMGAFSDILPLKMFCLDVKKTACIYAILSA